MNKVHPRNPLKSLRTVDRCQDLRDWHEGRNDPRPHANDLLSTLKTSYRELEQRLGQLDSPKGEKFELVQDAIRRQVGKFRLVDIERLCPGLGRDWIRTQLARMREAERWCARVAGQ
jgi:hypothetical protein